MTKTTDKIDDFDFGFSFADDVKEVQQHVDHLESIGQADRQEIEELRNRLLELHKAILPLLDNLCKDPDKPSIHWPDRVPKIEAYRKKLPKIVEGK